MTRLSLRCVTIGLILLLAACTGSEPNVPPPATSTPDPLQTPWDDRSIFENGLVTAERGVLAELKSASVYHIEFSIADDLYHITGSERVRYTNAENTSLNEVWFRLFPNILGGEMTISNLSVDGETALPEYDLRRSVMKVPFVVPLERNESAVVSMEFAITVPRSLDLNYGVLAYAEDVLALAHAYPMIAVFDDEGWNAEIPPQSGDVTYADASFYIVRVNAPLDVTLVTSGIEIARSEAGEGQTLVVASGPARDFYLAASSGYKEVRKQFGEVTLRSFAPADSRDGASMALDVASRAIDIFSTRYRAYPYTEFDIVATPTLALGIEYPGIVAITSRIYDVNGLYRGIPAGTYMESTVVHEAGHQWFYNMVGDDQLDDPWLDESLTQFATLQYYADEYGPGGEQGFRSSLEERWAGVGKSPIPIGRPVASYSGQEYGAIVYGRGPLFFVALREVMGREPFDRFIRAYTEDLAWQISTPDLLRSAAEQHCGCDLADLFEEWVY